MNRIAVFCGASTGHDPIYAQAAAETGRAIANRAMGIVYGGGHVGLMGIVADSAMKAGGEVIGVIPEFMQKAELAHQGITDLILVSSMHERKMRMHALSNAVIALPGGFGTMDEMFELLTWRQIKLHDQPIGLLNVNGFYEPLIAQMERMRTDGFLHGETSVIISSNVEELLDRLAQEM